MNAGGLAGKACLRVAIEQEADIVLVAHLEFPCDDIGPAMRANLNLKFWKSKMFPGEIHRDVPINRHHYATGELARQNSERA